MKKITLLFLVFFSAVMLIAQNPDAEAIKKKMTTIRQTTNWKNKEEAAKANAEINKLAKELMMTKSVTRDQVGEEGPPPGYMLEEDIDFKLKLWNQLWGSFRRDDNVVDMGKTLRDDIVEDYNEDSDHSVKCPEIFDNASILVINMSMKGVDAVIQQMPSFRNITTLVIICEKPEGVDLEMIFANAADYPLEKLCIYNFGSFVTSLPESLSQFKNLKELSLMGNNIYALPNSTSELSSLENLFIDLNPVYSVREQIAGCAKLSKLGLKETNVSEEEIALIAGMLPNCEILR